jgi:hypothetical protein
MDLGLGKDVAWDESCDYCLGDNKGNRITGLSLAYHLQHPSSEPAALIARSLEQVDGLRQGTLFRCRHCGRPWIDQEDGLCAPVSKRDLPVVIRWNDHPLPPDAYLRALAEIGVTAWGSMALHVPCRASVGSTWLDPCSVQLQNTPPLVAGKHDVISIDEVTRIEATEFALPLELREYGRHVPEAAMAYAPWSAYWGQAEVGFSGFQDLWGHSGMMGSDLTLVPQEPDWTPTARRPRALAIQPLTVVIGDLNAAARTALGRSGA